MKTLRVQDRGGPGAVVQGEPGQGFVWVQTGLQPSLFRGSPKAACGSDRVDPSDPFMTPLQPAAGTHHQGPLVLSQQVQLPRWDQGLERGAHPMGCSAPLPSRAGPACGGWEEDNDLGQLGQLRAGARGPHLGSSEIRPERLRAGADPERVWVDSVLRLVDPQGCSWGHPPSLPVQGTEGPGGPACPHPHPSIQRLGQRKHLSLVPGATNQCPVSPFPRGKRSPRASRKDGAWF